MDPELQRLLARRWRIGLVLTAVMMATYFGFILLVAFDKEAAGTLVLGDRVSIGIVLGALLIILAPILTSFYVRWANRTYDPAIAAATKRRRQDAK
ncbi:MAG: putative rane protein clustering with ActP [Myxococcales bacterium]|nr:putative rane protein clustering with ActP [Myxococcales bacterium]